MQTTSRRRRIYILLPLLILLLCIGGINLSRLVPASQPADTGSQIAGTAVTPPPASSPQTQTGTALPPPSAATGPPDAPTPTQAATPTPTPTIPPDGAIILSGPPTESFFAVDDTISFYWQWAYPLAEDQQLSLFMVNNGEEIRVASLPEPNFGNGYRWHAAPGELFEMDLGANSATIEHVQWLVRLETQDRNVLLTSEERSLNLTAPRARGS